MIDNAGLTGCFMQIAIVNIGQIISGDWESPYLGGSSILVDGDLISKVGELSSQEIDGFDFLIAAGGAVAGYNRLTCSHYVR